MCSTWRSLLGATFWIAARWRAQQLAGDRCRVLACRCWRCSGPARWPLALLGLFPIIFAMSRYLYLDFALTALVALDLALLIGSERFAPALAGVGVWAGAGAGVLGQVDGGGVCGRAAAVHGAACRGAAVCVAPPAGAAAALALAGPGAGWQGWR